MASIRHLTLPTCGPNTRPRVSACCRACLRQRNQHRAEFVRARQGPREGAAGLPCRPKVEQRALRIERRHCPVARACRRTAASHRVPRLRHDRRSYARRPPPRWQQDPSRPLIGRQDVARAHAIGAPEPAIQAGGAESPGARTRNPENPRKARPSDDAPDSAGGSACRFRRCADRACGPLPRT